MAARYSTPTEALGRIARGADWAPDHSRNCGVRGDEAGTRAGASAARKDATASAAPSLESAEPGLSPPKDEGVDVVGPLVGVDGLEVEHMADHVELVGHAVAAVHVARLARDV